MMAAEIPERTPVELPDDQIIELDDSVIGDGEPDENNYVQFLTGEKDPLPDDSFADPLEPSEWDITEEEALALRDDFDDSDEVGPDDELDEEDVQAEEEPDPLTEGL